MRYDHRLKQTHQIDTSVIFDPIDPDVYAYPIPPKGSKVKIFKIIPQHGQNESWGIIINMCAVNYGDNMYYLFEDDLIIN